MPAQRAPLHGIRVLDLTRLLPGPMCTLHLGDMGADVIKIEDTEAGDYSSSAIRSAINRNKRGIRLDLKHRAGVEVLLSMVRNADVLVEGFRPGVMARLGLGYDTLAAINPRLVYCSVTGYGQSGPYRDTAGHDINYCGFAGVGDQVGTEEGTLALSNLPLADIMGGALTAAMGILAALFDASRSGQGRHVDISISDGVLAHAVLPLGSLLTHGEVRPAGADTLTGASPSYGYYQTADGRHLAVGAFERKFWELFCTTIGRPDLIEFHRSNDGAVNERVRHALQQAIAAQSLPYWTELFASVDCCVSPVHRIDEALEDPHFLARGMVHHVAHGDATQPQFGCPVQMTGFTFRIDRAAPRAGEHTSELLHELGYDQASIERLQTQRIAIGPRSEA